MRKSTKLLKKFAALFLIVLISINTFAAVVGDNDGAAFITKAEFDSMKNGFQSQLDRYNSSIDNKIDGAIAAYLGGLNVKKQTDKAILIPNYNQMRWQPNFKVYGVYKKWSNRTTYQSVDTNAWYEPSFAEKRLQSRGSDFTIFDNWAGDPDIGFSVMMRGTLENFQNGVASGVDPWPAYDTASTCPTLVLELDHVESGFRVLDPANRMISNAWNFPQAFWVRPHSDISRLSPSYHWAVSWGALHLNNPTTDFTVNPLENKQILNYDLRFYGADESEVKYRSIISPQNSTWPIFQSLTGAEEDMGYHLTTNATLYDDPVDPVSYYGRGVTWHRLDASSRLAINKSLYYMALGTDYNLPINAWVAKTDAAYGFAPEVDNSTQAGRVDLSLSVINIANLYSNYQNAGNYGISKSIPIGIPHFPTVYLRDLISPAIKYENGQYLKMGQGLPLVQDIDGNGYVQISFDYDVRDLLTDQSNNKNIFFDVRFDDFNTQVLDFADGYEGFVNPDDTTTTIQRLQHISFSDENGKFKFTVPINKGDSLWFRMSPQIDEGGYYAIMDNLKITLFT